MWRECQNLNFFYFSSYSSVVFLQNLMGYWLAIKNNLFYFKSGLKGA
jgi:hypothetical protein